MHRNIEMLVARQRIERSRHLGDRLVLTGEGDPEGRHDRNGVVIDALDDFVRRHAKPSALERDLPKLDVEIPGEFVPADLYEIQSRIVSGKALETGLIDKDRQLTYPLVMKYGTERPGKNHSILFELLLQGTIFYLLLCRRNRLINEQGNKQRR